MYIRSMQGFYVTAFFWIIYGIYLILISKERRHFSAMKQSVSGYIFIKIVLRSASPALILSK